MTFGFLSDLYIETNIAALFCFIRSAAREERLEERNAVIYSIPYPNVNMNAFTALSVIVTLVTLLSTRVLAGCNVQSGVGLALTGHAYLTFPVQNHTECYRRCKADEPKCRSLNYHADTKQCELNNTTKTLHPKDVKEVALCTYFESIYRGKLDTKSCAGNK